MNKFCNKFLWWELLAIFRLQCVRRDCTRLVDHNNGWRWLPWMVDSVRNKILQPDLNPTNSNNQPINFWLWKWPTLASPAEASRVALSRLCQVWRFWMSTIFITNISLLPPELTERILSFLPASSLLACCQVENYLLRPAPCPTYLLCSPYRCHDYGEIKWAVWTVSG